MNIPGLITPFTAIGAIGAYLIAAHGATDGAAVQADDGATMMLGVTTDIPTADGGTADVVRNGLASVTYGGNVTRGNPLTADANGRAVAVALPAAADTFIVGFAEVSGVEGDIGSALVAPGFIPATAP
ncbi:DUF2190 domain-containing protein [Halopseudomonas phragmitis]|uniref:DUF2190 domain-containing protein n=1 Tax=Halopseudomonas phragmitis TaxID=1931241 RepID=A0A1V0B6L6_9GAMM|nr:DUF2190 domain-containing protein [Halopseudomonas phragmitis]AQZ95557.1 DUF2190 domain-containing protein [Halopseudomonas phragmitis]PAU86327.1 DUF2190 domain-containing protein [Pseudomonas sp. WN033]